MGPPDPPLDLPPPGGLKENLWVPHDAPIGPLDGRSPVPTPNSALAALQLYHLRSLVNGGAATAPHRPLRPRCGEPRRRRLRFCFAAERCPAGRPSRLWVCRVVVGFVSVPQGSHFTLATSWWRGLAKSRVVQSMPVRHVNAKKRTPGNLRSGSAKGDVRDLEEWCWTNCFIYERSHKTDKQQ